MSEKLRLKVTSGSLAGRELAIDDELVIGREADGDGQIADDVEMSRQHARISHSGQGDWAVEDLGSKNGTFVNGHRIEQRVLLGAGDAIEVGGTRLVVQVSAPGTAPEAPMEPEPEPESEPGPAPEPAAHDDTLVGDVVPAGAPDPEALDAAEPAEPALPPVSLTLDLDPSAGEAVISLGEGSDRVRLVFEDGAWRLQSEA